MLTHTDILRKCFEIAFETEYSLEKLSNEELEALLNLQYNLCPTGVVIKYLLGDSFDKGEEIMEKCRPTLDEALKRLTARKNKKNLELLYFAILPYLTYSADYFNKIEKLLVDYIDQAKATGSLSSLQECAMVAVFAKLHRLHANFDNPKYEFTAGKERVKEIIEKWGDTFNTASGWRGLPLVECYKRIICIQDPAVRDVLQLADNKSDEIFWHYTEAIDSLSKEDYCRALQLNQLDLYNCETYNEVDLYESFVISVRAKDLETRLLAADNAAVILDFLNGDEAMALASLSKTIRKRYAKALKIQNIPSLSDKELLSSSELVLSVINALEIEEADNWFDIENLQIIDVARQLCSELMARGQSDMKALAEEIGYYDPYMTI